MRNRINVVPRHCPSFAKSDAAFAMQSPQSHAVLESYVGSSPTCTTRSTKRSHSLQWQSVHDVFPMISLTASGVGESPSDRMRFAIALWSHPYCSIHLSAELAAFDVRLSSFIALPAEPVDAADPRCRLPEW